MEEKKTLYRDTDNKMLGGVASGLAEYVGWDISAMRFAFIIGWLTVPSFTLAYILAWIIIPGKYKASTPLSKGMLFLVLFICALPIILFVGMFVFILFWALFSPI